MRLRDLQQEKGNIKCCFCKQDAGEFGNNPEPIFDQGEGRCCNECNWKLVLPTRLLAVTDQDAFEKVVTKIRQQKINK